MQLRPILRSISTLMETRPSCSLATYAKSKIVLLNSTRKNNVFRVLGTVLTMDADSILVGKYDRQICHHFWNKCRDLWVPLPLPLAPVPPQAAVPAHRLAVLRARHRSLPNSGPCASPSAAPAPLLVLVQVLLPALAPEPPQVAVLCSSLSW
jgi:hypothetical protein